MSYKIVNTDNFNGDYPNESFLSLPVTDRESVELICDIINNKCSGETASRYWKVVEEGYELLPGFEP